MRLFLRICKPRGGYLGVDIDILGKVEERREVLRRTTAHHHTRSLCHARCPDTMYSTVNYYGLEGSRSRVGGVASFTARKAPNTDVVGVWMLAQGDSPVYREKRGTVYGCTFPQCLDIQLRVSLSSECGTYKTVKVRFWPWLAGKSP